jgi:hypothetical protein
MADLRKIALALPNVELGIACAGTALESRTYRTGKKAFLFVSRKEARLKLDASASEARELGFAVGANGWVTLPLEALPATTIAKRWVAESYGLVLGRVAARTKVKTTAATKKKR